MKRISIIFILFLCLVSSKEIRSQSYLGVKGGANIPFVNYADFTNTPISARFSTAYFVSSTFGISYRHMQSDKIGVQVDINYSTKGWGAKHSRFYQYRLYEYFYYTNCIFRNAFLFALANFWDG